MESEKLGRHFYLDAPRKAPVCLLLRAEEGEPHHQSREVKARRGLSKHNTSVTLESPATEPGTPEPTELSCRSGKKPSVTGAVLPRSSQPGLAPLPLRRHMSYCAVSVTGFSVCLQMCFPQKLRLSPLPLLHSSPAHSQPPGSCGFLDASDSQTCIPSSAKSSNTMWVLPSGRFSDPSVDV